MRIAIKNNHKIVYTICTTAGEKIDIKPNDYAVLNLEEDRDIDFWTKLPDGVAEKYGLSIIRDDDLIDSIESGMNVSITDGFVSPIARQIAKEDTFTETVEQKKDNGFYTEEQLLQMPKEDLMNICDNFSIKYKRNNSVKTLVALILDVVK